MKHVGFTLAEVLITLGIIGVISALTLPSLLNDTQGAQVGPKLGKAVSMFEQANQALLTDNNVDSISSVYDVHSSGRIFNYGEDLSDYLKISPYRGIAYNSGSDAGFSGVTFKSSDGLSWQSKDGTLYFINFWNDTKQNVPPHKQNIGAMNIHINRISAPNLSGTDIFAFRLRDDGSLIPAGSRELDENNNWASLCANDSVPQAYNACAGSIFENNMKVMYKMR